MRLHLKWPVSQPHIYGMGGHMGTLTCNYQPLISRTYWYYKNKITIVIYNSGGALTLAGQAAIEAAQISTLLCYRDCYDCGSQVTTMTLYVTSSYVAANSSKCLVYGSCSAPLCCYWWNCWSLHEFTFYWQNIYLYLSTNRTLPFNQKYDIIKWLVFG